MFYYNKSSSSLVSPRPFIFRIFSVYWGTLIACCFLVSGTLVHCDLLRLCYLLHWLANEALFVSPLLLEVALSPSAPTECKTVNGSGHNRQRRSREGNTKSSNDWNAFTLYSRINKLKHSSNEARLQAIQMCLYGPVLLLNDSFSKILLISPEIGLTNSFSLQTLLIGCLTYIDIPSLSVPRFCSPFMASCCSISDILFHLKFPLILIISS